MCGIAGFVDFNKKTSMGTLKKMTDAMLHRGPDDAGYEIFEQGNASIGFGQRRLSILDLSPLGHQPMSFEHISVDFNGEVYNFKEIKVELEAIGYIFKSWSDTEVIVKAYHCWGLEMLSKFIGMFAIAILDQKQKKVHIIRDRAGVKPLYYYWEDDLFLFGSELKAFYANEMFQKVIDVNSLALFLQYSYVPAPYCIFKNTFKLMPGHILSIDLDTKNQVVTKYWDVFNFYNKPKLKLSDQEAIDHTDKLLKSAYEYRMVSDVPVGVFLSGGYDSSSVASILQTGRTERLKTFTIGFHENEFNEAPEAKKIANYLGTDHTEWYLTSKEAGEVLSSIPEIYDEPFADNSTVPTVLVSKLAARDVKVALSADAGDEIFGGYSKFNQSGRFTLGMPIALQSVLSGALSLINPDHIPYFNKSFNFSTRYEKMKLIWKNHDPVQAMKYISQFITEKEAAIYLGKDYEHYPTVFDTSIDSRDPNDYVNRLLAIDYKSYLLDNNLVKVDRATMSVSIEGREPMVDHRIVEFTAQLSDSFKIREGVNKWLLKQVVHKYIPKEMMDRPKVPFLAPLMVWFKEDLKDQLRYFLSEESLNKTGLFDAKPIVQLRDDYLSGMKVNYQKLWTLLTFMLWYDRWVSKI
jgi:asparagine synthase (glutamine-hydrolysing)